MDRVVGCFVSAHDHRLVLLAAVVCALASFTAVQLASHAQRLQDKLRYAWLLVAAISCGFGIWATHFIAMLAFQPTLPSGYELKRTLLSLLAAISFTGLGLAIGTIRRSAKAPWIGGAVIGCGIAVMHYTGMAAYEVEGRIAWSASSIAASVLISVALAAGFLPVALRRDHVKSKLLPALILTAAICGHHFTGMSAVAIIPDPTITISPSAVSDSWLAVGVTLACLIILGAAIGGLALELREQRRVAAEAAHMRELADVALEGLVVCDGDEIVAANRSFRMLAELAESDPAGHALSLFLPLAPLLDASTEAGDPIETMLHARGCARIPVELIARKIVYAGMRRSIFSLRDLRDRKTAERRIDFLANHDPLTGLPNRRVFSEAVEAVLRDDSPRCAVMFIDLDGFKSVNDMHGHAMGDALLSAIGKRVTASLPGDALLARLGGDEFAILVRGECDTNELVRIADRVTTALTEPMSCGGIGIEIGASMGIARVPEDASDPGELLRTAEIAMYRAKQAGRGIYRFFEPAMDLELKDKSAFKLELRQAIAEGQIVPFYQPLVDLSTGSICGFEVLARWRHPVRGLLGPDRFIPVAEDMRVVGALCTAILRQACRDADRLSPCCRLSVNLSPVQLRDHDVPGQIAAALAETGFDPRRLEVEVTESALIEDMPTAQKILGALRDLGVTLALDDFGTGFSSLYHLRELQFDKIKIDKSFVMSTENEPERLRYLHAMVGLGRTLQLEVTAEGIETVEMLAELLRAGCAFGQGNLFGRPMPAEALPALIATPVPMPPSRVPACVA
jgi:diguanylate cyclase